MSKDQLGAINSYQKKICKKMYRHQTPLILFTSFFFMGLLIANIAWAMKPFPPFFPTSFEQCDRLKDEYQRYIQDLQYKRRDCAKSSRFRQTQSTPDCHKKESYIEYGCAGARNNVCRAQNDALQAIKSCQEAVKNNRKK